MSHGRRPSESMVGGNERPGADETDKTATRLPGTDPKDEGTTNSAASTPTSICASAAPTVVNRRIDEIRIDARVRSNLNETKVSELVQSIVDTGGLIQPITVSETGTLVAGRHRLEAYRRLGYRSIPCVLIPHDDDAIQIAEIDENLCRAELSVLEQAEHLLLREQILSRQGRRAERGRSLRARKSATVSPLDKKTTADLAADVGLGVRSVQHRLRIARCLLPELRDLVRSRPAANATRTLLALAKLDETKQRAVARALASEEAHSVAAALRLAQENASHKKQPNVSATAVLKSVRKLIGQLPDDERGRALALLSQWVEAELPSYQEAPAAARDTGRLKRCTRSCVDAPSKTQEQCTSQECASPRVVVVKLLVVQWREAFDVLQERGVSVGPTEDAHFLELRHDGLTANAARVLEKEQRCVLSKLRGPSRETEGASLLRRRIREILPELIQRQ